jgi:hypothetical protein
VPGRTSLTRTAGTLAAALLLSAPGCRYTGPTEVAGYIVLAEGETGDLRGATVQFFDTTGFRGPVLYSTRADTQGFSYRARFSVPDIPEGDFCVLVWQDNDASGTVSDGDLVGVHGGAYAGRDSAERVHVYDDWTLVMVPDIQVYRFLRVEAAVEGGRDSTGTRADFRYRLNHDIMLLSLALYVPGVGTLPDASAAGWKRADSVYETSGWNLGGQAMPTGWYVLRFRGLFDGDTFTVDEAVRVR